MADLNVCPLLTARSNVHNNISDSPNTSSGADKVINSLIDKGEKSDEELLKGLLSDTYCHVCSSQLMTESNRLGHYEGKKHAQKVRVFLEASRAEKTEGSKRTMLSDRFCELCNMVFSSNVVAKSHYEGKVHTKNLRKHTLQPSDKKTRRQEVQDHENTVQEENTELQLEPTPTSASCGTEVDLKDPIKYCSLCAASFNHSQMALQHYNGRKHQRSQARQTLLNELGVDVQQANSFMCHICGVKLGSVEVYQAHLQGNKHQIRKKKISEICKSQPKVYSTFADELADYIAVQKARGVTPKTNQVFPQEGKQKDDEEDTEVNQEELIKRNCEETAQYMLNPLNLRPPHHPGFGTGHPSYPGPLGPSQSSDYPCAFLFSSFTQLSGHPPTHEQHKRLSGSPPYSPSSYSSYSSNTSESDEDERRLREKRRTIRFKRERGGGEEMDAEKRRRKRRRRERDSEGKKREPSLELEEEEQRTKLKSHRWKEKETQQENLQMGRETTQTETLQPDNMMGKREETQLNTQNEMNADRTESGNDKPVKSKSKKEKKKSKEKADTRTEEEKLWDDSILGW